MTRNGFEDFENIVDIWLLKYLVKLLGSKLCIWIHLTCELLMWVCPYAMMLVIIPSLWCVITCLCDMWLPHLRDDKSGWRLPLCMTWVNPWVCGWGCCPYGQETTCKRGTVWCVIPCCPWGEEVNPWVCGWGQARPRDHMQKRYYMAHYPLLPIRGIVKSLRVWVRLGRANRPHAKRGTYHASVFGFRLVRGGMMS